MKRNIILVSIILISCVTILAFTSAFRCSTDKELNLFVADTTKSKADSVLQSYINKYTKLIEDTVVIGRKIDELKNSHKTAKQEKDKLTQKLKQAISVDSARKNIVLIDTASTAPRDTSEILINGTKIESLSQINIDLLKKQIEDLTKKISGVEDAIEKEIEERTEITQKFKKVKENIQKYSKTKIGSLKLLFNSVEYFIFVAQLDSHNIKLHLKSDSGEKKYLSIGSLLKSQEFIKVSPLMVTNAGMYTPKNDPQGLYIEKYGSILKGLDTLNPNDGTNFYLKPNGVFYIDTNYIPNIKKTDEFKELFNEKKVPVQIATQSGPMLVINGKVHDSFKFNSANKKIRNGVGMIDKKRIVFAISIQETNFYDFALLFKDIFDCDNALFLDGAISKMYLKDLNPSEKGGNFGPMISISKKK